ncbi:hypothetical protein DSY14_23850, partial [Nocardiopsis sp. MG754419]|nr:hypothetical protein [Nocardiopsis sp. MG754419]
AHAVPETTPSPERHPEGDTTPVEDRPTEDRAAEPVTERGSGSEADPVDAPATAETPLWEPPTDDAVTSALEDYVPPVWTPPEEDVSAESASAPPVETTTERTGSIAGLALDHDTGPEVRAAFRWGSAPPGAARPASEPEHRPGSVESDREGTAPAAVDTVERTGAVTEVEPDREPADDVPATASPAGGTTDTPAERSAPEPERVERTAPPTRRRAEPLRKRPMVLKPPRPPMPDFASGPPSRRVRSEPLPPEEH